MTLEILSALTILLSAFSAMGGTWVMLKKGKVEGDAKAAALLTLQEEKARALKLEQAELEARLRQEQATFRSETREDINRVKEEARHLEKLLHASEDENRSLRRRVLELEMEIIRLRNQLNGYKAQSGNTGEATITLTAERTDSIVVHSEAEKEQ